MANFINYWTKTAITTLTDSHLFLVRIVGSIDPISWASLKALLVTYFDTLYMKLTGNQTIAGTKTFSDTISGSITGNAGTVTNGAYTNAQNTFTQKQTFGASGVNITRATSSPVNSADPQGAVRDLIADDDNLYFKTNSGGWKKVRLDTF